NLSVVLGLNQGTFFEDPWPARKRLLLAASAVIPPALIVWYSFRRWRRIGRDYPSRGVVIPQYAPPDDLNVLGADVVLNERLGRNALSAALIDLAVRGYLKITETKKKKIIGSTDEYQLELLKDIDELPDSERQLLKGLFDKGKAGETVSLADKANKKSST